MANVPSAQKRNRQRLKRRARNLTHLTASRTLVKRAGAATSLDVPVSPASAQTVAAAVRQLDRAAQKGVLKRKTASRKISRLTKALARQAAHIAKPAAPSHKKS